MRQDDTNKERIAELKSALRSLGMSQLEFARESGYNHNTISRWVTDKQPIPQIVMVYLRLRIRIMELTSSKVRPSDRIGVKS